MMGKVIWVVDDDDAILEVFKIILQEEGHEVRIIQDGRTIPSLIKKEKPSLIFLDLLMSGIDGRDISQALKKEDNTKNIPIIITSADTNIENKSAQAQADGFLKKPFNIDDVTQVVKKYVK